MSYFSYVLKARGVRNRYLRYEREKKNAVRIHQGMAPQYNIFDRIFRCKTLVKRFILKQLRRLVCLRPGSRFSKFVNKLLLEDTLENYIAKSLFGFLAGMFLTYIAFIFCAVQLDMSMKKANILCGILGITLSLGLAFSYYIRCLVVLILPELCVKRGRQALMLYALMLTMTGPGKNTLDNLTIVTESLACGQEQLKMAVKQIISAIAKPFQSIKESITKAMQTIKSIALKIKDALLAIKRVVMAIVNVIRTVASWLMSIINMCNKELGTPSERCMRVFDPAIRDCVATLGPLFSWLCSIAYVGKALCYLFKVLDLICALVDFIKTSVVSVVGKKLKEFMHRLKDMFYVSLEFRHSYSFETEQSKSLKQVASDIIADLKERGSVIVAIFHQISFLGSCFFLIIIFRAIHYWRKYMTDDRFDNHYITNEFFELDMNRARLDLDGVLPLKTRERNKYVQLTSVRLTGQEKTKLTKTAVYVFNTSFKIAIYMAVDYCVYKVLEMIWKYGGASYKVESPQTVEAQIDGSGMVADLYGSVMSSFKPFNIEIVIDTKACLPQPIPPNYVRYLQIAFVILMCLLMAVAEPYVLRLRQWFMNYYYPDRAKQRTVWLYNNILRSRESFLKFARRQLRQKFTKSDLQSPHGGQSLLEQLWNRLAAKSSLIPYRSEKACLICANTMEELVECPKPGCIGSYCIQCFNDLKKICSICLEPADYGDLSDISEEKESSEDGKEQTNEEAKSTTRNNDSDLDMDYQNVNMVVDLPDRPSFKDLEAQSVTSEANTQQFSILATEDDAEPVAQKEKHPKAILKNFGNFLRNVKWKRRKNVGEEKQLLRSNESDSSE